MNQAQGGAQVPQFLSCGANTHFLENDPEPNVVGFNMFQPSYPHPDDSLAMEIAGNLRISS